MKSVPTAKGEISVFKNNNNNFSSGFSIEVGGLAMQNKSVQSRIQSSPVVNSNAHARPASLHLIAPGHIGGVHAVIRNM